VDSRRAPRTARDAGLELYGGEIFGFLAATCERKDSVGEIHSAMLGHAAVQVLHAVHPGRLAR
jgi:hypothetical protein